MYLSDFFDELKYGELANLALGNIDGDGILQKDIPRLIASVNSGLRELYAQFALKTSKVQVQLYDEVTEYRLHTDFAQSNTASTETYKYILDSVSAPFTNNLLLIDNIFDDEGEEYTLNESYDDFTINTPTYDTFEITFAHDESIIDVYYRAGPDNISIYGADPSAIWLPLPLQLMQCLTAFVLHKIHSSMGSGQEGSEAGMYYNKYLKELHRVKDIGLNVKETNVNTKLFDRGFP